MTTEVHDGPLNGLEPRMRKPDDPRPKVSGSPMTPEPNLIASSAAPQAPSAPRPAHGPTFRQAPLGPDIQALIGQQLRAAYHEVLNEAVPDRFVRLLAELAKKEAERS